ncbi:MAG: type II toxin-antitoxin system Phd/YefM family antitoxin [Acidobacteriota bacterium]
MQTISATEAKQRFAAVIDAAQQGPVMIRRQNRDVAVIISPQQYARIREHNLAELNRVWAEIAAQAEANGLTEEILQEILADDTPEK